MNKKPQAIIYARVSTNRQGDIGHSLDSQTERLITEAKAQGYEPLLVAEIGSGKRDTRPKLVEALSQLKAGKAQALFCLDIDRLARSTIHSLEIFQLAKKQGWRLVISSMGADTATPAGECVFSVMASFAQLEGSLTSERVKRQHQARRERGIIWGVHEGYKGNLNPKVRRIVSKLSAEGNTLRQIAQHLTAKGYETPRNSVWHAQTIKAILQSPQTKQLVKRA
jgi:DNA invertase Pin-like site-specific DNA recombinase